MDTPVKFPTKYAVLIFKTKEMCDKIVPYIVGEKEGPISFTVSSKTFLKDFSFPLSGSLYHPYGCYVLTADSKEEAQTLKTLVQNSYPDYGYTVVKVTCAEVKITKV